jgi:thiol-disulfide isomerase/thioredoxin
MIAFIKFLVKKFNKFHPIVQVLLTIGLLIILRYVYKTFLYSYFSAFNLEGFGQPKELVYFHMNGCGHCKNFTPIWDQFSSSYNGNLKLRKVERADAVSELEKYEIKGFPTILLLDGNGGKKEFQGDRTIQGLESFIQG